MNLNKNFLTEVIKYLISKGVTVHDVLDAFHAEFNYHEQASKQPDVTWVYMKHPSVEESSTPCTAIDSNRDLCRKVEEKTENTAKPVTKSWIDYPKTVKNHGNGVSPARKALFDVVGDKTVIEHLRANGIDYKVYDNRVRRKWSVAEACTTPLAPRGKGKRKRVIEQPGEPEEPMAVIVPDTNVKCLEPEKITGTKKRMMLVNGVMTEIDVSDTDLVQSSIEKLEETLETESNTEKATESVTIEPQIKTDTDTRVNDADVNNNVKNSESERIEQLADKTVRDIVTGKNKEKKKAEPKKDYTMADVCFKLNVTTHELKEMINTGEFPQPDCGNKWSVKLLKDKNLI